MSDSSLPPLPELPRRPFRVPRGAAMLFLILRWGSWIGLVVGILATIGMSFLLAGCQSQVSVPLLALVFIPTVFITLAIAIPWYSIPVVIFMLADIVWRLSEREDRDRVNAWLERQTWPIFGVIVVAAICTTLTISYQNRPQPSRFSIRNHTGSVMQNVVWETESGSFKIDRMEPLERRFFEFQPKKKEEKVYLSYEMDGASYVKLPFRDIDNTGKYFRELAIGKTPKKSVAGAWGVHSNPPTQMTIINKSGKTVTEINLNGLGWEIKVPTLENKGMLTQTAVLDGPLTYAISFMVEGKRYAFALNDGVGLEGYPQTIIIPADLNMYENKLPEGWQ